jgi:DNA-binding transcriptional regulator YiaG
MDARAGKTVNGTDKSCGECLISEEKGRHVMEIDVKEIRTVAGLSREGLARRLGVSHLSVFNWETGKTKPSQLAQEKILRFKRIIERQKKRGNNV